MTVVPLPVGAVAPAAARAAPAPQAGAIAVMIVDDSAVIRSAIARLLARDSGVSVVARAENGAVALEALRRQRIDVIVLDVEMPVMDGLTALPLLQKAAPHAAIIMASTLTTRGADISLRALRLGAADYVPKPSAAQVAGDTRFAEELLAKVRGLARLRRRVPAAQAAPAPAAVRPAGRLRPALLAIGSSTGGPNALFALVAALPASLPVPVIITQHMPPAFTPILAEHLHRLGTLPCVEASDGAALRPGHILLAPGDRHLLIRRAETGLVAMLSDAPAENFCRPSVDPMLRSASAATDGRVLAAILTGMGQDGLEGARDVTCRGGTVVAQDEATSVVWGMPGAVTRAGLAHAVLPLPQIAPRLLSLIGGRA